MPPSTHHSPGVENIFASAPRSLPTKLALNQGAVPLTTEPLSHNAVTVLQSPLRLPIRSHQYHHIRREMASPEYPAVPIIPSYPTETRLYGQSPLPVVLPVPRLSHE